MKKLIPLIFLSCLFCMQSTAQDLDTASWPNLTGYWKFQNINDLTKATKGKDLKLNGSHQWVRGPVASDTAIRIGTGSYYRCDHGISPNGGGDSVNQYTLMFDFRILNLNRWHTFFQTDTNNLNDGEGFIRPNTTSNPGRIGTATTGYTNDSVIPNRWYRLVISVNLGHFYRYYLNGELVLEGDTQDIDDRFALNPYFLLFADNNQEDDTIDIASVAVFDTCLSSADIAKLGTVDPCLLYPVKVSLGRDTLICGNNTLRKSLGSGNYTYRWSTGETDSALVFSMAKNGSGSKTIWGRKTDVNGCVVTDTFVLGIYNAPVISSLRDTNLCQGQSVRYIAGSALGNSYQWRKIPAGYALSKVNYFNVDSTGSYEVRMTNNSGCHDLDTVAVTVHALPGKPLITVSSNNLCQGDTALLTGPQGYSKYIWSNGENTREIRVSSNAVLKLTVRNAYECQSPTSDSIRITVHPLPQKPVIGFTPDTLLCEGDSCLLFVQGSYSAYIWTDSFASGMRYVHRNGSFGLRVKDGNGCLSPPGQAISVRFYPLPVRPVTGIVMGGTDLCPGDSAIIKCLDSFDRFLWSDGSRSRQITVRTSKTLSVQGISEHGCAGPFSDSTVFVMHNKPSKPVIMASGRDSLSSSDSAKRFIWLIRGQSGHQEGRRIAAEDSTTYVLVTENEHCTSDTSDEYTFIRTGLLHTARPSAQWSVYPNPNSGRFTLMHQGSSLNGMVSIRLYSYDGRLVFSENAGNGFTDGLYSVDPGHLPDGVYTLQILHESVMASYRLTVMHR